jgi:hypothetical protein
MGKLERIELMKFPDYDDRMIEMLIEVPKRSGVQFPLRRMRVHLIDRTISETQPQYVLLEDEDMVIWPQYLADSSVDLGHYQTEEEAIARCQEHHDSIYGKSS